MDLDRLNESRRRIADELYEGHDVSPWQVSDDSGWSSENGGGECEWTRPVFLSDPDRPDADTVTAHYTVRFAAGSDTVVDSYCILNGNLVGAPAAASPAP